jgi:hypothetical protein
MPLVAVARSAFDRERSSTVLGFDMLVRRSSCNLDWMRSVNSSYSSASNCSPSISSTPSTRSRRCVSAETDATGRELPPMELPLRALEDQFCGWLWMRGNRLGKWRHRYFCLNGPVLTYFVTFPAEDFLKQASPRAMGFSSSLGSSAAMPSLYFGDGSQPRGVLRVAHVDDTDTRSRLGFKIFGTCGKSIDIRAHSVDERNQWLRMLKTPARRKSRAWSTGQAPEVAMNLSSFDPDLVCTFDRQSIATQRSGWMHKRSDVLRRWRRYFFVIQDRMLSYYASDKPYEVPRRRGYVQSVQTVTPKNVNDRDTVHPELVIQLGVRGQDKPRELRVRFETHEELDRWRESLVTALAMGEECPRSSASTSALSVSAFAPAV